MTENTNHLDVTSPSLLLANKLEIARKNLQNQLLEDDRAASDLFADYQRRVNSGQAVVMGGVAESASNSVQGLGLVQVEYSQVAVGVRESDAIFGLRLLADFLLEVAESHLQTHQPVTTAIRTAMADVRYARQQMIAGNIGLVASIANKYRTSTLAYDDLLQEGVVGLIKAVDRFDVSRGYQFSTYATYWIKQAIARLINKQERIVHLPVALAEKASHVLEAMRTFYLHNERWPSLEQLQQNLLHVTGLNADDIQAIHGYYQASYSLDAVSESEEGDGLELMTRMRQQQFALPLDDLIEHSLCNCLYDAVASLPAKEAQIINMRFGLKNHTEMTLQAIADQLQVTRERVRQIQNQALNTLKARFGCDLLPFLEANDGY